jgi:hypothetical protein
MSEFIYAGLTSQSIDVMIYDSSSTTGSGLSGLVYNSSGLKAYYRIGATGASTAITLATQTSAIQRVRRYRQQRRSLYMATLARGQGR